MPWTLYSFISRELLKLLCLSALVLVLLVSTAAAIKPLVDGILEPGALLRFVLLMSPTMLQYALPFAAAFAAALVFSRLTADNEVLACSAGGMSYLTILMPVLFLGMLLMLGLFFLSNTLAPVMCEQAATSLQKDVIRMMVASLEKGRAFSTGSTVIYADAAEEHESTPEEIQQVMASGSRLPPSRTIALKHVAVGFLDSQEQVVREGTAQTANIHLFQDGRLTLATAYLENVSYYDAARSGFLQGRQTEILALPLPSPLRDKPQFLSRTQLRELRDDPGRFDKVARSRDRVERELAQAILLRRIEVTLAQASASARSSLQLQGAGGEQYSLNVGMVSRGPRGLELTEGVAIDITRDGQSVRRFQSESALLTSRCLEMDAEVVVLIELRKARVVDARLLGRGTEHATLHLSPARWPEPILPDLDKKPLPALLQAVARDFPADAVVQKTGQQLQAQINRLQGEIGAQINIRAASAMTCMLVLILGAVMGMRLRGRSPLVVFFWAFLVTLVVVIITNSGRTFCIDPRLPVFVGVTAVWAGNLILLVVLAWQHRLLSRH